MRKKLFIIMGLIVMSLGLFAQEEITVGMSGAQTRSALNTNFSNTFDSLATHSAEIRLRAIKEPSWTQHDYGAKHYVAYWNRNGKLTGGRDAFMLFDTANARLYLYDEYIDEDRLRTYSFFSGTMGGDSIDLSFKNLYISGGYELQFGETGGYLAGYVGGSHRLPKYRISSGLVNDFRIGARTDTVGYNISLEPGDYFMLEADESRYDTSPHDSYYGSLFFQTGANFRSGSTHRGDIYLGTGTEGHLKAKTDETDIIFYDSTTGKLTYGTAPTGGGASTITDLGATAWRVFYSNGSGDVTELALGADGTYLGSNGAGVAPSFKTPGGSGDMLESVYATTEAGKVDTSLVSESTVGLSLGSGSLATVGDDALTFTTIGTTGVTLPESGTLATLQNINDSINARIGDGLNLSDIAVLKSDSTGGPGHYASWHDMNTGLNGKEDALGNPGVNGYVLSSTTEGVRTWIENGSGGSMVYPSGSGIPIVSSGASWGTTITDNSTNWNSAYSWGNHASAGYEPGLGNPASDGYVLTSTAAGVRSWAASSGTVTIEDVSGVVGDSLDAIRAASVQGLTLGDSSLYVTQTALNTAIAGVETGAVDSSLYVTVTRLTDSLNVIREEIAYLVALMEADGSDVTKPTLSSAELGTYNDSIILTIWSENLQQDSIPPTSAFALTEDGNTFGIEAVTINEDSLFIALDSTGAYGSTYLLSYTPGFPAIQDSSENNAVSFTGQAVTNNISAPGAEPPSFLSTDNNTVVWLMMDNTSSLTVDGSDRVSAWADALEGGVTLTQAVEADMPILTADGLVFDGISDYMDDEFTISTTSTMYIVFAQHSYTMYEQMLGAYSTSGLRLWQSDTNSGDVEFSTTAYGANVSVPFDSFVVLTSTLDGTSASLALNDETPDEATIIETSIDGLTIGSGYDQANFSDITIKEIIIRDGVDSSSNRTAVYNYLVAKYGLE